jgi:hypothetical protein
LSDEYLIQNDLKQEDALSPLLFNFTSEYVIREAQENKGGFYSGIHQLPIYADNINVLGENINTIKKSTEVLFEASREVWSKIKYGKN